MRKRLRNQKQQGIYKKWEKFRINSIVIINEKTPFYKEFRKKSS